MARGEDITAQRQRHRAKTSSSAISWPITTPSCATWPGWVASGQVRYREDIRQGLENLPAAFAEMLKGGNFGKMLVEIGVRGPDGANSPSSS